MANTFNEDHQIETYKSMVTISIEVFKYLALLNGGAAAGMLAIFDRLSKVIPLCALKVSLVCFVVGLLFTGIAVFCSYWTQNTLFNEGFQRLPKGKHVRFLRIATATCVLSLLAFCIGASIGVLNARPSL
ncbi:MULTISPECIES: hypothetical protein [Burkholderia]|uniref:hypothetical protein n=1 Tax=Burkholderia TaxID=32008 RepID=UPI000C06F091|nr:MULTISPECIES: hypothetical protein [Burkholderia]MCA8243058.1 hypothetical protein [Burkholderia sp. AU32262]PHP86804.1 hypothetical protein CFB52_020005 [Burkholderia sp. AU18528]RQV81126.1 hypothetical protein DF160_15620 [Burkholderia anthina]RQX84852.1 hypothetical protein DF034_02255 [Burkholderia anthina]